MVDVSRYIETASGSPTVKWGLLVSTIAGALLRSLWLGWIESLSAYGDGLGSAVAGLRDFISMTLIGGYVDVGALAIERAFASNAAFVGSLGAIGIIVAVIEIAVMFAILLWAAQATIRGMRRALG
ncbi:hypothetical protein [Haloarcula sp. CGMCC 1.2071]|uniref:hypothetical protein n=1 Tax=Haloarcula sp. CGMCC 1.2071 TaxID=3111454 RepID=UPI00300F305F